MSSLKVSSKPCKLAFSKFVGWKLENRFQRRLDRRREGLRKDLSPSQFPPAETPFLVSKAGFLKDFRGFLWVSAKENQPKFEVFALAEILLCIFTG